MSLVLAKCPYCGENIETDNAMPAFICTYCGHPVVTEHAVDFYARANNKTGATLINRELEADFVINDDELIKYKGEAFDVIVPKGIKKIKGGCFARQNIRSVRLPEGLEELESASAALGVFSGCSKLKRVNLPGSLKVIGDSTFSGCTSLDEFELPDGTEGFVLPNELEVIGAHAFEGCQQLDVMDIPESVKEIRPYAFARCYNLKRVTLPSHMTVIPSFLFFSCLKLTEVNIENITKIEDNAFNGCIAFTKMPLHEGLTAIGEYSFKGCIGLTEITLPESLLTLDDGAFDNCSSLKSIRFPEALQSIGDGAFRECENLLEVEFTNENVHLGEDVFEECLLLKDAWVKDGKCRECGGEKETVFLSYVCKRCKRKSLTRFG